MFLLSFEDIWSEMLVFQQKCFKLEGEKAGVGRTDPSVTVPSI